MGWSFSQPTPLASHRGGVWGHKEFAHPEASASEKVISEASLFSIPLPASAWSRHHSHQGWWNRVPWAWGLSSKFQNILSSQIWKGLEIPKNDRKGERGRGEGTRQQRSSEKRGLAVCVFLIAGSQHFSASAFLRLSTIGKSEVSAPMSGWASVFWDQTQWGQIAWLFATSVN